MKRNAVVSLTASLICLLFQSNMIAQSLKIECATSSNQFQAPPYRPPAPIGNVNMVVIYAVFNTPPPPPYISYQDSLPFWNSGIQTKMQSFLQTASQGLHNITITTLTNGTKPFRAADNFVAGPSVYQNISPLFMSSLMDSVDARYNLGQFDNDGPDGIPNSGDDDGYVDYVSLHVLWPAGRGGVGLNFTSGGGGEWISSDLSNIPGWGNIRVTGQNNGAMQQIVYDQVLNEGLPMHEYGHSMAGLPDMDHVFTTYYNHYSIGGFDIMAGGGFQGVASIYNPWFRDETLHWITPTQVSGNLLAEVMTDLITTAKLLKYSPSTIPSNALSSQKFYVSYHTGANQWESNWPITPTGQGGNGGMLVWHVTGGGIYSDRRRQPIDIEAAHGKFNWTETATAVSNTGVPNATTGLDSLEIRKIVGGVETQGPYFNKDKGSASIFFVPNSGKTYTFSTNPNSNYYHNSAAENYAHNVTSGFAVKNIVRTSGTTRIDLYTNNYTITSNATLTAGNWYVNDNITVATGVTLTINPGAVLRFASGKKLTVNGSIQAIGTSSQPIIFDRSAATGTWSGIWIENSTAVSNFDYCTSRNASYGIRIRTSSGNVTINHATLTNNSFGLQTEFSSPYTIQNSTLQNNAYGIYVNAQAASGSINILSNIITQNTTQGVYLYNGADPYLGFNMIDANCSNSTQAGVFCITNSDPFMRSTAPGPDYGNNYIRNNLGAGVKASNNSFPILGIDFQQGTLKDYYGYNEIYGNGGAEVHNGNTSGTIIAERNYWSSDHNVAAIPSDLYGSVDYTPVLGGPPTGIAGKFPSLNTITSAIDFEAALALEMQDQLQAAADLYFTLLQQDPNADNVGFGVSGLIRCYKGLDRRADIVTLLDDLILKFPDTVLEASAQDHSLPYLVNVGRVDDALARAVILLRQNRNVTDKEPDYLFRLASLYLLKSQGNAGIDLTNALAFYQELIQKYAASDFAFVAKLELEQLGVAGLGKPASETASALSEPQTFTLYPNHPNPFNPETRIKFYLQSEQRVVLRIYDVSGRLIQKMVDGVYQAGEHFVIWNGKDFSGVAVGSGVYFYELVAGDRSEHGKMTLLQ